MANDVHFPIGELFHNEFRHIFQSVAKVENRITLNLYKNDIFD